jgi:hypothetical protein
MSQVTKSEQIQACNLRIKLLQKQIAFKRIIEAKMSFLHQIKSVIQVTLDEIDHFASEYNKVQKCRKEMDMYLEKLYTKSSQVVKVG